MNRFLSVSILSVLMLFAFAQVRVPGPGGFEASGTTPITQDGTGCTATPTSTSIASCSMTVTAGSLITLSCYTNNGSFDPSTIWASDPINGYYQQVQGNAHPTASNYWVANFIFPNSAGGTITPNCIGYEPNGWGIAAQAWKNSRTSFALDGGATNLFHSASVAAANPTAGTAGAPTNANSAIMCQLARATSATTSSGAGFNPAGTLTGVVNTVAQYFEFQIQTTATAVNCPYTSASAKYTDGQFAILNASSTSGYFGLMGLYGAPASAQTNGATATLAILNGSSGSLTGQNIISTGGWAQFSGTAVTFDTSVAPLGTLKLLTNGVAHTLGDAATSIKVPAANTTTAYGLYVQGYSSGANGAPIWLGSFMRMGTNATSGTNCDTWNLDGTVTEGNWTTQLYYDSTHKINFQIERSAGDIVTVTSLFPSPVLNLGQDYYVLSHVPGVNETTDDIYVFGEATPGVLPWVLLDHFSVPRGGQLEATTTATASSGANSITVASATGIVVGQSVFSATTSVDTGQITQGTTVTSVSGTTIGISNITNASMSATPVEFAGPTAHATGSVTAGSTTLTVSGVTGTIVSGELGTGQLVGMNGVIQGTLVASGSGTTWTLSQPATSTQTNVAVNFFPGGPGGNDNFHFGKFSSCTSTADMWFSGFIYDPYSTILPLIANGTDNL